VKKRSSGWRGTSACEPLLDAMSEHISTAKDPFKEPFRRRVMESRRASETLEPYALLHMDVIAARHLLACDVSGRSDPFVEVYLNDRLLGKSAWRVFTVNPTWDFKITLEIYSPFSILHIRIMDHDTVSHNDLIGFVEIRVADLLPNTELVGWCELRRKRHLHGYGPSRVRRHKSHRDDDPAHQDVSDLHRHLSMLPSQDGFECALGPHATPKRSPISRCASAAAVCCGKGPKDGSSEEKPSRKSSPRRSVESLIDKAKSVLHGEVDRPNAGELRLSLRLETPGDEDDEWYACCFPRPNFFLFPSSILNLGIFYHDLCEIRDIVTRSLQVAWCVPHYLMTWQCRPLSAALLAWWCLACLWPAVVLPTMFMWPVILLHFLRRPCWQEAMLVHESTSPLNEKGFVMMAALGNTTRMKEWIRRVIRSMGLVASDEYLLHHFAALVFRDGTPDLTFEDLIKRLSGEPWLHEPSGPARCTEGHLMIFLGAPHDGKPWICQHPKGCLNYGGSHVWGDISRYHCKKCSIHICEPCMNRIKKPPFWTRMPSALLPDNICILLMRIEEPLERLRIAMEGAQQLIEAPFKANQAGKQAATTVTSVGAGLTVLTLSLSWVLHGPGAILEEWFWSAAFICVGVFCFMSELRFTRRYVVALRASMECTKCLNARAKGSFGERCAFFTPDPTLKDLLNASKVVIAAPARPLAPPARPHAPRAQSKSQSQKAKPFAEP